MCDDWMFFLINNDGNEPLPRINMYKFEGITKRQCWLDCWNHAADALGR